MHHSSGNPRAMAYCSGTTIAKYTMKKGQIVRHPDLEIIIIAANQINNNEPKKSILMEATYTAIEREI